MHLIIHHQITAKKAFCCWWFSTLFIASKGFWVSPFSKYTCPIKEETKPGKLRPMYWWWRPVLVTAKILNTSYKSYTTDRHITIPLKKKNPKKTYPRFGESNCAQISFFYLVDFFLPFFFWLIYSFEAYSMQCCIHMNMYRLKFERIKVAEEWICNSDNLYFMWRFFGRWVFRELKMGWCGDMLTNSGFKIYICLASRVVEKWKTIKILVGHSNIKKDYPNELKSKLIIIFNFLL